MPAKLIKLLILVPVYVPFSTGVSNIARFKDKEGLRTIQFDIQERDVILGIYDTGNFTFQVTLKEIDKDTATQMTATLVGGMLKCNQGFHLTDSKEGGTLLEDRTAYTAPRLLARLARKRANAIHTAVTENIRQYFLELSQQPQSAHT